MTFSAAFAIYIKFFFILTPFFILAVFLALTEKVEPRLQRMLAARVTLGIVLITVILFLFGAEIFALLGITIDSFRAGAGALLFLSAVSLTEGRFSLPATDRSLMDLAIVPLAIPITIGPGSVGALIIIAAETADWMLKLETLGAILLACLTIGAMLLAAPRVKKIIGSNGISMLSKVTGLVLAALSCQMMIEGVRNQWGA